MTPETPPSAALRGAARAVELPSEQFLLGIPCGPSYRGRVTTTHFQILELPPDEGVDNAGMQADDCADGGENKGNSGLNANYAEDAFGDDEYVGQDEANNSVSGAYNMVPGRISLFFKKTVSRRGDPDRAPQPGYAYPDSDKDSTQETPEEGDVLDMLMGLESLNIEASKQTDDIDFVVVATSPVQSQTSLPE